MTAIKRAFDGAERSFEIQRAHLPFFEAAVGSVYLKLQRLTAGNLTFDDIAQVISFALHGPSKADAATIRQMRQAAKFGMQLDTLATYRSHPDVVAVLERDGHGNYAPLAADILANAVFGGTNDE